ncbi:3D-(3,5/4)-trihydroxycyclohexane-1,2-dione acylhydrolase (decyclizing) [Spartinivicinus poritis]|uniref:3D-(3,5/4)-trihydroxycyclohexane-1,2-dione acylhydrolase (Decyclizing) n=1 Tax=Spartinivicinus poritis TaxID=2994640 RepID=A0ABT5UH91_9GAMM|nr:3D-(3,5/4)-trihydroxycyclohexane-1,2-dione acylhydrolase (decyclizing) [Spartinivicinus sp. A2-2]MDE1465361.1 3D-(3,5/4)-trihydroxycyclohexane-1,2-dione acylhydrolase (decyclizing) [Spartinivicinus sp. A2-2]
MNTIRLTMAQALVKYLAAQFVEINGNKLPLFEGVFAIFGHGNVAGLGEALFHVQNQLPTYRAHNEQGMAHAAIAFAKANNRRRMMGCTTSIGPGATNMVTSAALAHVNRLPVLFLPGDTFANRLPDPVLQQVENFTDPTITANDCFKPVSRYFDRITRPEQIIASLPVAIATLTDPTNCGPVTLALPQDVQAMSYDYPSSFFEPKVHHMLRQPPDQRQLMDVVTAIVKAEKPVIIAGGGVHYSEAIEELNSFTQLFNIPVAETQAGKGALPWDHPNQLGSIGVTGSQAANTIAEQADLIIAIGTRLQDFTTSSRTLVQDNQQLVQINVAQFDAVKHNALPLIADAKVALQQLSLILLDKKENKKLRINHNWLTTAQTSMATWNETVNKKTDKTDTLLPTDAQVLGAVNRAIETKDIVVCAAGGLPSELHKLWKTTDPKGYHVEYGFSCMGYEIAGGLGVKMACPDREVIVMVGDGSYMMLNSEIATSVMLGKKLIIIVLDNHGFGCINRLQQACGGAPFNNLLADCKTIDEGAPVIDFAAHAQAMGATAEHVQGITELEAALKRAKQANKTYVISLNTDPVHTTSEGGSWWDVAIPEVSQRQEVIEARDKYEKAKKQQPY